MEIKIRTREQKSLVLTGLSLMVLGVMIGTLLSYIDPLGLPAFAIVQIGLSGVLFFTLRMAYKVVGLDF